MIAKRSTKKDLIYDMLWCKYDLARYPKLSDERKKEFESCAVEYLALRDVRFFQAGNGFSAQYYKDRNLHMLISYYGFDGRGRRNFRETSLEFGVGVASVRQAILKQRISIRRSEVLRKNFKDVYAGIQE